MYKVTDMPWLAKNRPEVLKDRMLGAFMEHNCSLPRVFEALGITGFTYYKYVKLLGLQDQLADLREAIFPNRKYRGRHYVDGKPQAKAKPVITAGPEPAAWGDGVTGA